MPPDRDHSRNPPTKRTKLEGELKKRTPQRPATIPTDIYVSNKSSFVAQLARAKKLLLLQECASITIHGLGASIEKSIQLALKLQVELSDQVELKCTTGTVELVDDIIPEDMEEDLKTQTRNNSAVHIVVTAKPSITSIRVKAKHTARPGSYRANK
ncbi:hypothetical protein BC943DRAFT_319043 [Umbelopsis sp. AD052]|nr:hypothetical protein BC943DRAFT_319043 [Umbelopsis sp. AD052]